MRTLADQVVCKQLVVQPSSSRCTRTRIHSTGSTTAQPRISVISSAASVLSPRIKRSSRWYIGQLAYARIVAHRIRREKGTDDEQAQQPQQDQQTLEQHPAETRDVRAAQALGSNSISSAPSWTCSPTAAR